jgi:hypothetical protein
MKTKAKNLFFLFIACATIISCSSNGGDNTPVIQPLNSNEMQLVGTWEYLVTPHPSGAGGPASYYKSYFTFSSNRTGTRGFNEFITPTQQYSGSENFTWTATVTTGTFTFSNGTQETGNYQLLDATHIKMYNTAGTSFTIYTKQ